MFIMYTLLFVSLIYGSNGLSVLNRLGECTNKGGFCTNGQHCFNSLKQNGLCGEDDKTCCFPKQNDTCINELCGDVVHDCIHELTYNYRHPKVCKLYERCGLDKEAYFGVCTSIDVRLTCCARESTVTPTGELIGPKGDIEGIIFNGLKLTNDNGELQFYIAGFAAFISLIVICILICMKYNDVRRGQTLGDQTRCPNREVIITI